MTCSLCDSSLAPTGPRQSEGHFAIRFTDTGAPDFMANVFKDGKPIWDCYEVIAPEKAWRYVTPPQACANSCPGGAEAYIDESGGFSVRLHGQGPLAVIR